MKKITLEKVIAFLKVDLLFACCWPVSRDATKFQIVCDRIFRVISSLHAILLMIELIYTIIYRTESIQMLMQSTCAVGILSEVPLQILLFTLQHDRLQYPFPIDRQLLRAIVYCHHMFGIYQIYCQVSSNVFLAFLLWFTSARFEISNKFRTTTKYSDWKRCISEHQELLRFAQEISLSISYIILLSLGISTYSLVFGGVSILSRIPLSVKAKFFIVCVSSLLKVLLCAWPADYLMTISSDIGDAAYDSLWYKHGIDSQKMMLYILLRCQRPIIITVPGLLAALTFQHYTSYISTAFSFLTTFRIILSDNTG
ncbi:odorant receptor 45b-like [Camponotus floridanus]|uniref:odorant receptor 45b-like n=1 Tax=Camponotus floridanus TaxID=104421 RepID=UPI000DC69B0E|nr:odorant receptor 45b-like [Camponotus floridanus]